MEKALKIALLIIPSLVLIQGCTPDATPRPCTPSSQRDGSFCYRGHDFGRISDSDYRLGIRDGCDTGSGYFRKDYSRSAYSKSYQEGWMRGRTLCRPQNWSDEPTYSYHPLPDRRGRAQSSSSTQEPSIRYLSSQERPHRLNKRHKRRRYRYRHHSRSHTHRSIRQEDSLEYNLRDDMLLDAPLPSPKRSNISDDPESFSYQD